jgi:hypothetical protein
MNEADEIFNARKAASDEADRRVRAEERADNYKVGFWIVLVILIICLVAAAK